MNRPGWRQLAHLALAAAGVAAVLWAVVLGANPTIWCREQVMHAGQVCANAQGTKVQTYDDRLDTLRAVSRAGISVCSSGMPVAAGPLWRTTMPASWFNSPAL